MRWSWACVVAMVAAGCAVAQESPVGVPAEEAWRDNGKTENVCGQVVDTSWSASVANAATYLYLERPRPEQVFTVVIPAAKRDLFGDTPETSFRGKQICVSGKIETDTTEGAVDRKHRVKVVVNEEEQVAVR